MRASASAEDVAHIVGLIEEAGGGAHVTEDGDATVIGAIGERAQIAVLPLEGLPGRRPGAAAAQAVQVGLARVLEAPTP